MIQINIFSIIQGGNVIKKKYKFLCLFLYTMILLSPTITVFAQFLTFGWPTKNIPLKSYDFNKTWQKPMDNGFSSWNTSGANIKFIKSSTAKNIVYAGDYAFTSLAETTINSTGSKINDFTIRLNAKTINDKAPSGQFSNYVRSIFTHELGHTIWLSDNPDEGSISIMDQRRDRNVVYSPKLYDVNGVNRKYE